jgi:Inner membrane protein YgaP-like, transmembrane domain
MIEKNLGNLERTLRLIGGIGFALWVLLQPDMNGIEWFVSIISVFLILNGIFSRCYLWFILDINSRESCVDRSTGLENC